MPRRAPRSGGALVAVRMPGGALRIDVGESFEIALEGPVSEVARGTLSLAFVRAHRRVWERDRRNGSCDDAEGAAERDRSQP